MRGVIKSRAPLAGSSAAPPVPYLGKDATLAIGKFCHVKEVTCQNIPSRTDQPIPVTVPVALEGGQQLVHFGLGQVLPDSVGIVTPPSLRATGRITILFGLPKLWDFARHFQPPQ